MNEPFGDSEQLAPRALDYALGRLDREAPQRVWLQIDTAGDNSERDVPWPGSEHVTWQDESIGGLEVEYVRADLAAQPDAGSGGDLPVKDPTAPNAAQGLYRKFEVRRTDGSDRPGGKHHGCQYFVLDMTHDPHSKAAASAYADSVEATHPQLAEGMRNRYALAARQPVGVEPVTDNQRAAVEFFTGNPVLAELYMREHVGMGKPAQVPAFYLTAGTWGQVRVPMTKHRDVRVLRYGFDHGDAELVPFYAAPPVPAAAVQIERDAQGLISSVSLAGKVVATNPEYVVRASAQGAPAAVPAAPKPLPYDSDAFVQVPRFLISAACYAIKKNVNAPATLSELRRYTIGDLSMAAQVCSAPAAVPVDVSPFVDVVETARSYMGAGRPDDDEPEEQQQWDRLTELMQWLATHPQPAAAGGDA